MQTRFNLFLDPAGADSVETPLNARVRAAFPAAGTTIQQERS